MDRSVLAQECVEVERAGGSVRDYLRERGFISPWGTWYRLQKEELHRKEHEITYGRENTMATRVSLEQKKKAVQIALDGGNPFDFLRQCGSKEPAGLWWTIKQNLKKVDPETYAKLPKRLDQSSPAKKPEKAKKNPGDDLPKVPEEITKEPACVIEQNTTGITVKKENPETGKMETVQELSQGVPDITESLKKATVVPLVTDLTGQPLPVDIKTQEIVTDLTEQQLESLRAAPVLPMSFRVVPEEFSITGLKTEIGSFTKSSKTIIWYPEVAQAVQLPADKWKTLVDILPKVIAAMNL